MTDLDDFSDYLEETAADLDEVGDEVIEAFEAHEEQEEWLEDFLVEVSNREIAVLYSSVNHLDAVSDPGALVDRYEEMERNVDARLMRAGRRPFFHDLPEGYRPSEMYEGKSEEKINEYEPSGFLEGLGARIWGDK